MELKEFIAETLAQICEGMAAARARTEAAGGKVGPTFSTGVDGLRKAGFETSTSGKPITLVDFDVLVSASSGTSTGGKLSVVTGFLNADTGGASRGEQSIASRVKFRIPMQFPDQDAARP